MPYRLEAEVVLAAWRDVERQLLAVPKDSPEEESLQADALRLRDEYQRLIQEAIAHDRPVPPPFPSGEEAVPD